MGNKKDPKKRERSKSSSTTGLTPPEKMATTNQNKNMNTSNVIAQANESIYGAINSPPQTIIDASYIQPCAQNAQPIFCAPQTLPYPLQSTPVQDTSQRHLASSMSMPPPTTGPQGPAIGPQTDINFALNSITKNISIINNRLESVDIANNLIQQKLQKLDMLDEISRKLQTVEDNVANMKYEINEIKAIQTAQANTLDREEQHHNVIEDRMRHLEERNMQLKQENAELHEQFLQFQTHSMKYNLIFAGLPEGVNETREQTENVVKNFIDKELGVENAENIQFLNVHRLKPRNDGKPRSIIARFINYADHQKVLSEVPDKLKLKPQFSVYQQYPQEISDRRKKLVPKLKEFQRQDRRAKIVYDKLIVDGRQYIPPPPLHGGPNFPGNTR